RTKGLSLETSKAHPNKEASSRTSALSKETNKAHPNKETNSRTKALSKIMSKKILALVDWATGIMWP
ncbi:hypothetical protein LEMLEM_LOCUS13093, partial [Lemmus lemmus]